MSTSATFECDSCLKRFRCKNAAEQHMRDNVHHKSKNENGNDKKPRCLDWVFANLSNVHVAKDRGWFTEYTPFETELGDVYGMMKQPIRVLGIGTVELFTEPPPGSVRQGQDLPPPLRLTTVLHAPSATCNIIGVPIMDDYELVPNFREKEKGFIADQGGRKIAYFDPSRPLMQVKLRDPPPPGHNVLKHGGGGYFINAKWSDSERERWHAHQTNTTEKKSSLSVEEKTWLKKYYGSEFSFLRQYGLNIYQEEDREEGRILLRSFMQAGTEKEASTTASKRRKLR